jgi:uncharacterized membrane protein
MTISTQTLPENYVQSGEVNLKKNKRLAIVLNIAAFFIFVVSFILLSIFSSRVRPDTMNSSSTITFGTMLLLVGLTVITLMIHELIHGSFFWMFTRSRPVFGVSLLYAYAGAPTWYIPTRQYAATALAPLLIIGVAGMLLILLVPVGWILMLVWLIALNTGGAIGDLYVFTRLLKLSPSSFANDTGDIVTFFVHP